MKNPRSLKFPCAVLLCTALLSAQDKIAEESIRAQMNAAITPGGALQANIAITAIGSRSLPYRQSFSAALLGRFMQNRRFESTPAVTNANSPERPVQIQFAVHEDDLILPVHRQVPLQLDLLPFSLTFTAQPDGSLSLGHPGVFHEEIALTIPENLVVPPDAQFNVDRPFAHYQSESKIAGGRLTIVRDLQLKQEFVSGSNRAELEAFSRMIHEDQQHPLILKMASHTGLTEWINAVPIPQTNAYAQIAIQQRKQDAARQLLERFLLAYPNDPAAWNNLGLSLAALGKLEDAQKAYEKQIAVNPKSPRAYNNLGLLLEREGRWDKAVESFRKQLELHPGDVAAISDLPRALIHAGHWADAERAALAQPAGTQQKVNVAVARVCQDKISDPREAIDAALGARPSATVLNNAAYYLTECRKEDKLAESYIRKALDAAQTADASSGTRTMANAISVQNTLSLCLDTYGWLLFNQGRLQAGIKAMEASVALSPRADVYAHLAEAESNDGRTGPASIHWREATFLQPVLLPKVPASIAGRISSLSTLSVDREWYPLKTDLFDSLAGSLLVDHPSYFFVAAGADGKVQSARELDSEDAMAKTLLPAVKALTFPLIQLDTKLLPSIHLVKIVKGSDGKVFAGRSVGTGAVAIATDLAPDEFPLPASSPVPNATLPGDVYRIGGGVSQPRILRKIDPTYSEEARRARLSGGVKLQCIIDEKGTTRDLKVERTLGLGLDEKAIEAVSAWQFQPGVKDGQPVNVYATIDVNFHMLDKESNVMAWHLTRVEFRLPKDSLRPVLEKIRAPRAARDADAATVTLTFDVNEHGDAVNIKVEKSSDEGWAKDAAAALREWKFAAAEKDGSRISVPGTIDFMRGN